MGGIATARTPHATSTGAAMAVVVELSAVIVAVRDGQPWVLMVDRDGRPALPSGPFDPVGDRTLDRAMRRWGTELTGVSLGFVEQLYTFGDIARDPQAAAHGERVLSIAYLAFVTDGDTGSTAAPGARWVDVYDLLPWEDRRDGEPEVVATTIHHALAEWCRSGETHDERVVRRDRADQCWSTAGATWDPVRSLERYELLFEAGLVAEASPDAPTPVGTTAALDHRRILASALGRVRGKLTYRPVVFELLPDAFTLLQLQRVVEALVGVTLHKQNFRRLVEGAGLVEGTGKRAEGTAGRPAELFRFRREVLRERPAPGMNLPGRR
ncbi:MAG: NUDIX hydrolase [Ilumatobacteraceae bacterium]